MKNKYYYQRYIHYNKFTGEFTRIQKTGATAKLGKHEGVSRAIRINGEPVAKTHLAWLMGTGEAVEPHTNFTFINEDNTDYRLNNLHKGTEGVAHYCRFRKGSPKFRVYRYLDGKHIYLGIFCDEAKAKEYADKYNQ